MMTFDALHLRKALFQPAAFEVIVEFLLYVQGQGVVPRGHHIFERRAIPLDDLIEKCPFRSMTFIGRAAGRPIRNRRMNHSVLHSMELSMFL
jgi:hypothetical protein